MILQNLAYFHQERHLFAARTEDQDHHRHQAKRSKRPAILEVPLSKFEKA